MDWAKATAKYIRDRRQAVSGRRISDLFDANNKPLMKVPGPTRGKERLYTWSDFMYDLKGSGLSTVPAQDESEPMEDNMQRKTDKKSCQGIGTKCCSPSSHKVQFFGKSADVCRLYDEEEFDHMMAPFEVSSLEEQTANTPPAF